VVFGEVLARLAGAEGDVVQAREAEGQGALGIAALRDRFPEAFQQLIERAGFRAKRGLAGGVALLAACLDAPGEALQALRGRVARGLETGDLVRAGGGPGEDEQREDGDRGGAGAGRHRTSGWRPANGTSRRDRGQVRSR
jgi:hypothetical protein